MKSIFYIVKNWFLKVKSFLPSPLPVGMEEFEAWSGEIVKAYSLPDNPSIKFALAAMIVHLDATAALKPKRFFGLSAKKSMSNQIALEVMQELKRQQVEANAKAAEESKKPEATSGLKVVSSEPQG